jgi:hypothetical protein
MIFKAVPRPVGIEPGCDHFGKQSNKLGHYSSWETGKRPGSHALRKALMDEIRELAKPGVSWRFTLSVNGSCSRLEKRHIHPTNGFFTVRLWKRPKSRSADQQSIIWGSPGDSPGQAQAEACGYGVEPYRLCFKQVLHTPLSQALAAAGPGQPAPTPSQGL